MTKKIEKINELVVGEASLDDHFVIKDILNGKKNLGEYKDFKRKIDMRHGIRQLYDAIEDWLASLVLCGAEDRNRNQVHVNLVKTGFILIGEQRSWKG